MWQILRSPDAGPEFRSSATELLRATTRTIILSITGICFAWHVGSTIQEGVPNGWHLWVTLLVLATCAFALRLLPQRLLLGQTIWLVGLLASVTFALIAYDQPVIAFLYVLLPLVGSALIGWQAGVVAELVIVALMFWLNTQLAVPIPSSYVGAIAVVGIGMGLLGWASTHTLMMATRWSISSFNTAQQHLQTAQQQRGQLAAALKDLNRAYYGLERANAALVAARKAAEEAERFRAEFATNVSHELRTPLNLIVGFSDMMLTAPESYNDVPLPPPYRSDLNAICHSAQHLLALVDDVIDMARIDTGKIPLVREPTDAGALAAESAGMMREYITAKGLELRLEIAPNLPMLSIDRLRVRQVLLNLLVNAARFTERGGITIEVCANNLGETNGQPITDNEHILFRVSDTGKGILPDQLEVVFEEFHTTGQQDSTWHSSSGLGLPISRKFIELHGGKMGVASTQGAGTTFWFTLPTAPAEAKGAKQAVPWRPFVPLHSTERILVVVHEDARIVALIQRYLDGYRVEHATNLSDALALAEEVQAIAVLTEHAPLLLETRIPIIQCPLPDRRRTATELHAHNMLIKPVQREELVSAVEATGAPVERVLLVDDDPAMVRLFRRMLGTQFKPHAIYEAHNGVEALELLREHIPDLLLLDLSMPHMDGYGVLREKAADPALAHIPAIIISAQDHNDAHLSVVGGIQVVQPAGQHFGQMMKLVEANVNVLAANWNMLEAPGSGV